jgi:hypothetical protein
MDNDTNVFVDFLSSMLTPLPTINQNQRHNAQSN